MTSYFSTAVYWCPVMRPGAYMNIVQSVNDWVPFANTPFSPETEERSQGPGALTNVQQSYLKLGVLGQTVGIHKHLPV